MILNLGQRKATSSMNTNKFLYECWTFIKKMNQNASVTSKALLGNLQQLTQIESMHGTLLYRFIFNDRYNKMRDIFMQIDNIFYKKAERKSLYSNISRFKVLLKYELPYESSLVEILPLLSMKVSRTQLIDLCNCLQIIPRFRSERFETLICRIYQLIEEELDRTVILDNIFLITILKLVSRSAYRTPQSLKKKLDRVIDSSLYHMENAQIFILSNMMFEKSNIFIWELIKREEKDIFRKILAKHYLKNKYGNAFEDELLPGQSAETVKEVEEAILCVQSILHKQPYIEVFPARMFDLNQELVSVSQYWRLYVDYLFYHLKKQYYRLPQETIIRFVTTLSSLLAKDKEHILLNRVNLIKLLIILFDASRDKHLASIQRQLKQTSSLVKNRITVEYLNSHPFQAYQFAELQILSHYLMHQVILIINGNQGQALSLDIIESILKLRRQKYKNKAFENIEEIVHIIRRNGIQNLKGKSLVTFTLATPQEREKVASLLPSFEEQLKIQTILYKSVIVYPNVQLSYVLVNQNSQLIWALDYQPLLNSNSHYLSGEELLPLKSSWKQQFLSCLNCPYHTYP